MVLLTVLHHALGFVRELLEIRPVESDVGIYLYSNLINIQEEPMILFIPFSFGEVIPVSSASV